MNYAFQSPSLNQNQDWYSQRLRSLSPASRLTFENIPATGFEYWLSFLAPSLANETALRRLYNNFKDRYAADVASRGAEGSNIRWDDWLGGQDIDSELARQSTEFRGQQPSRFFRPARYVSF